MIYVPECGLPPPIECIRRRCCVTDRSWASALPFLFCATLAISKFGAREWRASRGPPRYPGSPFRCVGRAPRSARTRTGCGVLTASASERNSIWSSYCACRRHQSCHGEETETSVRRRFCWAALGQDAACQYLVTWGVGTYSTMADREITR